MQVTTIGLVIAKNVFQVHGIDATEKVVVRKQLRRGLPVASGEVGRIEPAGHGLMIRRGFILALMAHYPAPFETLQIDCHLRRRRCESWNTFVTN